MTRLVRPVTIPYLLGSPIGTGTPLVLDVNGEVILGSSGGGGGIPEAPTDGQQYGRQNASWTLIVGGGFSGDHADLTNVTASQHHVRYSNSEAIAAVDNGTYLKLAGGTMVGFLTLNADPTAPLHAATKQYVDGEVSDAVEFRVPFGTGLLSGGELTFSGTQVTVAAGTGVISDGYTNQLNPTHTMLSWSQQTVDLGPITTRGRTNIWVNSAGVVQWGATTPTPAFRTNIFLGYAYHAYATTGDIIGTNRVVFAPGDLDNSFWDLARATQLFPLLVKGTGLVETNLDLTFGLTEQRWWAPGINQGISPADPNFRTIAGVNPTSKYYLMETGVLAPAVPGGNPGTTVNPSRYESAPGTIIDIPGSANRASIQRLYLTLAGNTIMMYGQQWYDTLDDAAAALNSDIAQHQTPVMLEFAELIAYFIMEKGATNLSAGADVYIVDTGGIPISGGAVPSHNHDLVYLRVDGTNVMQASLNMDTHKVIGVVDPTDPQDAATKNYVDTSLPVGGPFLPLAGGTMAGPINMGGSYIDNISVLEGAVGGPFIIRADSGQTMYLSDDSDTARLVIYAGTGGVEIRDSGGLSRLWWNEAATQWSYNASLNMNTYSVENTNYVTGGTGLFVDLKGDAVAGAARLQLFSGDNPTYPAHAYFDAEQFNFRTVVGANIMQLYPTSISALTDINMNEHAINAISVLQGWAGNNFIIRDGAGTNRIRLGEALGTEFYSANGTLNMNFSNASTTFSKVIEMGGNLIKNLLDPVSPQDAATKKYVDDNAGGGGPYLPLSAGASFPLTGALFIDRANSGMIVMTRNNTPTLDGSQLEIQLTSSVAWLYVGSADGTTFPLAQVLGLSTSQVTSLKTIEGQGDFNLYGSAQKSIRMRIGSGGAGHAFIQKTNGRMSIYDYSRPGDIMEMIPNIGVQMFVQDQDSSVLRNTTVSTVAPTGGVNGDVWIRV